MRYASSGICDICNSGTITSRRNINLYISAWIPHEIPDVIIYHLCKLRDSLSCISTTTMRDVSFVEYDIASRAAESPQRYAELLQEYAEVQDPLRIPLGTAFHERYPALSTPAGQKPPIESYKRLTYWGKGAAHVLHQPAQFCRFLLGTALLGATARALRSWHRWRLIQRTNAYYDAHAVEPDLMQPFVYFPLHYQPEASTVPMGAYADQLLVAALLNAHLPEGVLIYIKEHPRAGGWLTRSPEYYAQLLAMKKVRLIARAVDTFLLREHCRAVATVTGSAGFEALFRGSPFFSLAIASTSMRAWCVSHPHGRRLSACSAKRFLRDMRFRLSWSRVSFESDGGDLHSRCARSVEAQGDAHVGRRARASMYGGGSL